MSFVGCIDCGYVCLERAGCNAYDRAADLRVREQVVLAQQIIGDNVRNINYCRIIK